MEKTFQIYYTSDTHGHIFPVNYASNCPENSGLLNLAAQVEKGGNTLVLDGGDALVNGRSGESIAYDAVPQALEEGRIYPALLMCFLPLLFARGVRCFGGCFQPEYLRAMRDGLALALRRAGRASLAGVVASQDPSGYLSGPMFLEGASGTPRGIVELLAQKPSISERKNWMNVTFEQAHRIALANLYPDVVPANERVADFTALLAR